jgi:hypothetical protein
MAPSCARGGNEGKGGMQQRLLAKEALTGKSSPVSVSLRAALVGTYAPAWNSPQKGLFSLGNEY